MRRLLHRDEPTIQVTSYNNPRVSERRQLFVHEIYLFLLYIIIYIYILTCKNALCAAMIMVGDPSLKRQRKFSHWSWTGNMTIGAKSLCWVLPPRFSYQLQCFYSLPARCLRYSIISVWYVYQTFAPVFWRQFLLLISLSRWCDIGLSNTLQWLTDSSR